MKKLIVVLGIMLVVGVLLGATGCGPPPPYNEAGVVLQISSDGFGDVDATVHGDAYANGVGVDKQNDITYTDTAGSMPAPVKVNVNASVSGDGAFVSVADTAKAIHDGTASVSTAAKASDYSVVIEDSQAYADAGNATICSNLSADDGSVIMGSASAQAYGAGSTAVSTANVNATGGSVANYYVGSNAVIGSPFGFAISISSDSSGGSTVSSYALVYDTGSSSYVYSYVGIVATNGAYAYGYATGDSCGGASSGDFVFAYGDASAQTDALVISVG